MEKEIRISCEDLQEELNSIQELLNTKPKNIIIKFEVAEE